MLCPVFLMQVMAATGAASQSPQPPATLAQAGAVHSSSAGWPEQEAGWGCLARVAVAGLGQPTASKGVEGPTVSLAVNLEAELSVVGHPAAWQLAPSGSRVVVVLAASSGGPTEPSPGPTHRTRRPGPLAGRPAAPPSEQRTTQAAGKPAKDSWRSS
jgi:hypothetical protein